MAAWHINNRPISAGNRQVSQCGCRFSTIVDLFSHTQFNPFN